MAKQASFSINTNRRTEFIKIDHQVQNIVTEIGIGDGICCVYVPHTTAAVTINEGADPSVVKDVEIELNKIIPIDDNYSHLEGNSAAHIKASIIGASETVIIEGGRLQLGTWQSIFLCEFDGPRKRTVWIKII